MINSVGIPADSLYIDLNTNSETKQTTGLSITFTEEQKKELLETILTFPTVKGRWDKFAKKHFPLQNPKAISKLCSKKANYLKSKSFNRNLFSINNIERGLLNIQNQRAHLDLQEKILRGAQEKSQQELRALKKNLPSEITVMPSSSSPPISFVELINETALPPPNVTQDVWMRHLFGDDKTSH